MKKLFQDWWSRADTYIAGLYGWQFGEVERIARNAFKAGYRAGKKS